MYSICNKNIRGIADSAIWYILYMFIDLCPGKLSYQTGLALKPKKCRRNLEPPLIFEGCVRKISPLFLIELEKLTIGCLSVMVCNM